MILKRLCKNAFHSIVILISIILLASLFLLFGCGGGGGGGGEDNDTDTFTFYRDSDGDGYGNPNDSTEAESQPTGYVSNNTDCNDADQSINPNATEICGDSIDQDCNGSDLSCPILNTYYRDSDSDGYGDPNNSTDSESQPLGFVLDNSDCDDSNQSINPGEIEIVDDNIDQNCDGNDLKTWYVDTDGDGFGNISNSTTSNLQPSGYIDNSDDCDDSDSSTNPNQKEVPYNGKDDDCNSSTLDDDLDQDGYLNNNDCDDSDQNINPDAVDTPNDGIDQDCNGEDELSPIADAGVDQSVPPNSTVTLNGLASYDPNSDPLTVLWSQVSGEDVILSNPNSASPTFSAPLNEGELIFSLTVNDGKTDSVADTVTITVITGVPIIENFEISPDPAVTTDTLITDITIIDLEGDPTTVTYEWQVNRILLDGQTGSTLGPEHFVKNDVVKVIVEVSDGLLTTSQSINLTIQDSPPTVTSDPPTEVDFGTPFSFQIHATDIDNDPINYSIFYGPSGMQVDNEGLVTWTSSGPMFDTESTVNWGVRVTAAGLSVEVTGSIIVTDDNRQVPLARSGIEVPVQNDSIVIGDFNGEGNNKILLTDNEKRLYTLSFNGTDYVQDWFYPFDFMKEGEITTIASQDIDRNGYAEFFVGVSDGDSSVLFVIDGVSRKVISNVNDTAERIESFEIFDVDGDTNLELVYIGEINRDWQIIIRDAATLDLEWQSNVLDLAGYSIAIGNVDSDEMPEIVASNGIVFGYNGVTYIDEWTYEPGFGYDINTGDIDNDGIEEIVGLVDGTVRVYDAIIKNWMFDLPEDDLSSLNVINIDSDPSAEMLVGEGQWGDVMAYSYDNNASAPSIDWRIRNPDHAIGCLTAGDVDNDGEIEFIWSTGIASSGEDSLVIAGLNPDIVVEWQNTNPSQLDPPYIGAQWLSLQPGDNRAMFATARTDSSYEGPRLIAVNSITGDISISPEVSNFGDNTITFDGADYDGDGVDEIFLAKGRPGGYSIVYDFYNDTIEWLSPYNLGDAKAVTHGDLNGDGNPDFVVISESGYLGVYDVSNYTLLWSTQVNLRGHDVELADIDSDGELEIVAAFDDNIMLYKKVEGHYENTGSVTVENPFDIAMDDLDGNGTPEIISTVPSRSASEVKIFNQNLESISQFTISGEIMSFYIEDLDVPRKNLLLSMRNVSPESKVSTYLVVVDALTGHEITTSPPIISYVPKNSLHFHDTDGDGQKNIIFGTYRAMYITR